MTTPHLEFDSDELTLEISGLGGGWTFGHLGSIRLFDHAQVQFPSDWDELKIGAATRIIETSWQLHGSWLVESTLQAGIDYTRADGVSGSAAAEAALVDHILNRPTVTMDFRATVRLDGTITGDGFSGTPHFGLALSGTF